MSIQHIGRINEAKLEFMITHRYHIQLQKPENEDIVERYGGTIGNVLLHASIGDNSVGTKLS
jgi:hypothetical protein